LTVVPLGDVSTRTIPVKIRIPNRYGFIEGMSARVFLPTAEPRQALLVPRDAVISRFGRTVVFVVRKSRAAMIPVEIIGYDGPRAGVAGPGLAAGMQVVVKGNERVQDGQPVVPVPPQKSGEGR